MQAAEVQSVPAVVSGQNVAKLEAKQHHLLYRQSFRLACLRGKGLGGRGFRTYQRSQTEPVVPEPFHLLEITRVEPEGGGGRGKDQREPGQNQQQPLLDGGDGDGLIHLWSTDRAAKARRTVGLYLRARWITCDGGR